MEKQFDVKAKWSKVELKTFEIVLPFKKDNNA